MPSIRFCFPKLNDQGEENIQVAVSLTHILMLEYKCHCLISETSYHYCKDNGRSFSFEQIPCVVVDAYRTDITQETMERIGRVIHTILLKDVGSAHPILVSCHTGSVSLFRSDDQALSKTA